MQKFPWAQATCKYLFIYSIKSISFNSEAVTSFIREFTTEMNEYETLIYILLKLMWSEEDILLLKRRHKNF